MNLLAAYVRANLNRSQMKKVANQIAPLHTSETDTRHTHQTGNLIHAGDLIIDQKSRLVNLGSGIQQHLSEKEMLLLALLASHPGKVFTKNELIDQIWGKDVESGHHAVDSTIKRLRKKIEPVSGKHKHLLSSRGLGYRFVATDLDLPVGNILDVDMDSIEFTRSTADSNIE
jgi:DNA-binding response OmpR family regulator